MARTSHPLTSKPSRRASQRARPRPSSTSPTKSYKGKWLVLFAWPKDFTFVCPTEIAAFGKLNGEFCDRDAQVLGLSTDSEFVHLAWKRDHEALRDLPFSMLAEVRREQSASLGILYKDQGVYPRATFVVDPEGVIRHVSVNDLSVGRNPQETLRILVALKTDELCPATGSRAKKSSRSPNA